jgi:hypothetical protein
MKLKHPELNDLPKIDLSLHSESTTRQPRLFIKILLARLSTQHIVEPSAIRLELDATVEHDSEVEPSSGVSDSGDFVRHVLLGVLAHASVETLIGVEVVEVVGDSRVVSTVDEVSGLAVDNLKRDTTGAAGNDGLAGMESFRDLDLEALTSGQLESNAGVGHQRIEDYTKAGCE